MLRKQHAQAEKRLEPLLDRQMDSQTTGLSIRSHKLYVRIVSNLANLGMGWAKANQNQHVEAIGYFDNVLSKQPKHLLALIGKGNSLIGLHKLDEAQQVYKQVLKQHPANPYALAELAVIKYNKGDIKTAERLFSEALAVDDQKYTCPYEGLGLVYLRQGKLDQAKKNFQKAIELNPDIEYKKFNGLAKIYMKEGDLEKAKELLIKSIENYPYDDEAKELLEQLTERNPQEM